MDKYINMTTGVMLEPASPEAEEQLRRDPAYRQWTEEKAPKPRKRQEKEG